MPTRVTKPTLKREDFLAARPQRAAGAILERRDDGSALVKIAVSFRWPLRAARDSWKTFELDEMGLWVWNACNGAATLLQIINALAKQYGLTVRESEMATTKFMEMLAARRLITVKTEPVKSDKR
jgi:hypothetical protein